MSTERRINMASKIKDNFVTEAKLQERIDEYFKWADSNNKPYSIARLAWYLGVTRQTIYNYEEKDLYGDVIKRARDFILAYLEEKLIEEGKAGQIFLAKNYGYTDRQEIISNNTNFNANAKEEDIEEYLNKLHKKYVK